MRLIDADALGVGRCSRDVLPAEYCAGWNGLVTLIEQTPAVDAVEVVRCRDYKHYYDYGVNRDYCCHRSKWGKQVFDVKFKADDFCSYGERKEK